MDATLAQELLLLAYVDASGRARVGSIELDCGLAGAALSELSLAGRIDSVDGRVRVLDPAPTGDAECDTVLARIAGEGSSRKPDWWVGKLRHGQRNRLLVRLVDQGVLRMEQQDVLWLFSVRRYFAVDPGIRSSTRAQLERVVVHGGVPDARTASLVALLDAAGLARRTFPELDRNQRKIRMSQLGEGQWVAAAVRKAIRSIQSSA
jgi:Golgi phosphoprotein 3 (GPP34)